MANSFLVRWMDWRWLRGAHCYKLTVTRTMVCVSSAGDRTLVHQRLSRVLQADWSLSISCLSGFYSHSLFSYAEQHYCRQNMKVTETVISRTLRMKIRQMDKKLMRAAIFTRIRIFFGKAKVHRLSVDSAGTWCGQPRSTMNRDAVWWETAHLKTNTYLYLPAYRCDFQCRAHI